MARGKQLSQVVESLENECRLSTATSRGIDNREFLKHVIRRMQELLYDSYDWPFLKAEKAVSRKTLAAGQRYYDFPAGISRDRIINVHNQFGTSIWVPIEQGITPEHYTAFDSDSGARADPVLHWDYHGASQFEVWPTPASSGGQIWFEALVPLPALTQESDALVLDDIVVYMHCAAEILASGNQKDAQAKLTQGQDRLRKLLGHVSSKKRIVLGGSSGGNDRKGKTALRVAYVR
jgi:hypothetical protein